MDFVNLKLAHNIGDIKHSNYHTREQILNCTDPIGFDGIYMNVYDNMDVLEGKSGILFVMGNYLGHDNVFDLQHVPKLEHYCNWDEINQIIEKYPNFKLGWHTWSHPDLTTITNVDEIIKEITPPFPMDYFAYPYGNYNDLVIECVKKVGYKYAWSVTQGTTNTFDNNYNYKIYRNYI
jgi:hypothetical protein